jgi:hypothetical protein
LSITIAVVVVNGHTRAIDRQLLEIWSSMAAKLGV